MPPMENFQQLEKFGRWIGTHLLFTDSLKTDQRVPLVTFRLPNAITSLLPTDDYEFGILPPSVEFWLALALLLIIEAIFSSVLSCIMYYFIVLPRKKYNTSTREKNGGKYPEDEGSDLLPFLVGFGVVMPICVFAPFYGVRFFFIQNKILKFLAAMGPLTTFFRCSEAMFGFLPTHVDESLSNLLIYNASPVEVKFNSNGAMKSSWNDVVKYAMKFGLFLLILGSYCSFLSAYDYEPFPVDHTPLTSSSSGMIGLHGLTLNQMLNNALAALLFQLYLTAFSYGINTLTSTCGVQQIPMMLNPLFESTSPSDFWGRKWNMVVHGLLKRGVYKPVRSHSYSRFMASTAAFIASGVFHEWLLLIVFYPENGESSNEPCTPPQCYRPGTGMNTLFFLWNAIVIGMEYAIGGAAIFQVLKKNLHSVVLSILVASLALPVAHWFTNDYIKSDYFQDGQIGFPMIVRMSS